MKKIPLAFKIAVASLLVNGSVLLIPSEYQILRVLVWLLGSWLALFSFYIGKLK